MDKMPVKLRKIFAEVANIPSAVGTLPALISLWIYDAAMDNLSPERQRVLALEKELAALYKEQPLDLTTALPAEQEQKIADMEAQISQAAEKREDVQHKIMDWASPAAGLAFMGVGLSTMPLAAVVASVVLFGAGYVIQGLEQRQGPLAHRLLGVDEKSQFSGPDRDNAPRP